MVDPKTFRSRLMKWYAGAARQLPWRRTRDPYRIWISEVMLQQTRVAAVIPFYERFVEAFPDFEGLARARESAVVRAWSGLGYYSRARNLLRAARQVAERGEFPRDYDSIRELPGIGDYTAAAVASIAFGLPYAVLDGNVARVLSRLTNEWGDIGSARTRSRLRELAFQLLDRRRSGEFNQAIMELGATICLPKTPDCARCPVSGCCEALRLGTQDELPVKLRRAAVSRIRRTLLVVEKDGKLLLWRRRQNPMAGFWELPEPSHLPGATVLRSLGTFRHSITNHNYTFEVAAARVNEAPAGFRWLRQSCLHERPLSTTAKKALRLWEAVA
jgi:A/G-specific adenine glycosylase